MNKIAVALLEQGMCAEDVAKLRYRDKGDIIKAFKRNYEQGKRSVQIGDKSFGYEEVLEYLTNASKHSKKTNVTVAKIIPFSNIEEYLESVGKKWGEMSPTSKKEFLFSAGLAVMEDKGNEGVSSRYEMKEMYYRGEDNKQKYGLCVVGSERIDKEWLQSGYASHEAKVYDNDYSMRDEINMMSKSSVIEMFM